MTALAWLNDLVQWFARWVPRLVLIEPTHRGVLFGPRGGAREVGPGLVVYWPITHALTQLAVTTQSVNLSAQILPIAGDTALLPRVLLCAVAIQFKIVRPVAAATKALHIHALVDNRAQAALARNMAQREDLKAWSVVTVDELRRDLEPYGVDVERLDFVQHGTGMALKNVADWGYSDGTDGKRPS